MTCPTPEITPATPRIVRHAAFTASRPLTDTPSHHAPFGPVPRIAIGPRIAGARNIDLTARAVTQCNRDPRLIQRYLATHEALTKPTYSEGDA